MNFVHKNSMTSVSCVHYATEGSNVAVLERGILERVTVLMYLTVS